MEMEREKDEERVISGSLEELERQKEEKTSISMEELERVREKKLVSLIAKIIVNKTMKRVYEKRNSLSEIQQ